jgi:hypothetical protein
MFIEDHSIERGTKVLSLLNQLQNQRLLSENSYNPEQEDFSEE